MKQMNDMKFNLLSQRGWCFHRKA